MDSIKFLNGSGGGHIYKKFVTGERKMKYSSRLWRPTRTAFSSKMSASPSRDLCSVMESLKYAKSHEWAKVDEGKLATVGITDHAQENLGDIIYVKLPDTGVAVTQASTLGSVESVKASTDIKSPVSGNIIEVNEELLSSPGLVNGSPYEKGWIMKEEMSSGDELDYLMDPDEYYEYVKQKIPNIPEAEIS